MQNFNKGDVIFHYFEDPKNINTVKGPHRSVVLHTSNHPNNTVSICPISSCRDKHGNLKTLQPYHVELKAADYPALDNDSFIKTDQVITVDRANISQARKPFSLNPTDSYLLDLKIITLYEMAQTVKGMIKAQVKKDIETIVEEIDQDLKTKVSDSIKNLIIGVNNEVTTFSEELGAKKKDLDKLIIKLDIDLITKIYRIIDDVLASAKDRYCK